MSRGKKDREEITNTEEVKETEVSDEMEKAEDSEKAEDDKKPEETKETDDKHVYVCDGDAGWRDVDRSCDGSGDEGDPEQ